MSNKELQITLSQYPDDANVELALDSADGRNNLASLDNLKVEFDPRDNVVQLNNWKEA
jgi:hypothetical protein